MAATGGCNAINVAWTKPNPGAVAVGRSVRETQDLVFQSLLWHIRRIGNIRKYPPVRSAYQAAIFNQLLADRASSYAGSFDIFGWDRANRL
jgi:hypothetical protein